MQGPYLRNEALCSPPTPYFENIYLIIWNSSPWEICLFFPLIYLWNHLFMQYGLKDIYFICELYNPILL